VDTFAAYQSEIVEDVWQRALVNEEFTAAREKFGDAIRSGDATEVDVALQTAERNRRIAMALDNQPVLRQLDTLKQEARSAKVSQQAPAPARNQAAKRQKARGYHQRNHAQFLHADPYSSY
jgi:hypothetical protein